MSEIDKLINQAFPDELRDIEPIDVDEDAILSRALENLGLKPSPRLELPELTVKHPRRRNTAGQSKKEEPEFVEVPGVVHHRWRDWAGWAFAACLVLVVAVNWGPWLIKSLDFGLGPRSAGDAAAPESGGSPAVSGGAAFVLEDDSQKVSVAVASVSYGAEDTVTIEMTITPVMEPEELDLDQFDIRVSGDNADSVVRLSRSNEGNKVSLKYQLNGYRTIVLEIKQAKPLIDSSGNEVGFGYQAIDEIEVSFIAGQARSLNGNGVSHFDRYGAAEGE